MPQQHLPERAAQRAAGAGRPGVLGQRHRTPPGGEARDEGDGFAQQRIEGGLAAPQAPGADQSGGQVSGDGVRGHRVRLAGHVHAVGHARHVHRRGRPARRVEAEMESALYEQHRETDAEERALPSGERHTAGEHGKESRRVRPHRWSGAGGQGVSPCGEQHADDGEHRRAHAPHRPGHCHCVGSSHAEIGDHVALPGQGV
ncbi:MULTISPECIES: hypothetical protein [unclassified Streptomyces]|uniref:hypothetical protein n=1 Tax=unclassified Streptomyces TaxID=2593676 RepID=UPI003D8EA6D3